MELDEAIKHAEEVAIHTENNCKAKPDSKLNKMYKKIAEENRQLAEWLMDYKRLLDQEPTTKNNLSVDCIDRTQAQTGIELSASRYTLAKERGSMGKVEWSDSLIKVSDAADVIRNLPSVIPKGVTVTDFADKCRECGKLKNGKWIPVSERLPEERDWYLGIFKEPDTGWINPIPYICDYVGVETVITTKEYWILNGYTDRDKHIDYYYNLECVAWCPLPEPYQVEKE